MALKSLSDFINDDLETQKETISEANFLSKTFALSQLAKFKSVFQKLKSQSSKVRSTTARVKNEDELARKIDLMAEALEELSLQIQLNATLSSHIQNTVVADNLLSANLGKILKQRRNIK